MPTVTFQPEADSYYAEGYWRDGDLWSDFARRAEEHPDKPALILDDRVFTFDPRRRRHFGPPGRRRCATWGRRDPPGPALDRGRGRDARLHAPRRGDRAAAA